jgi:hypothetical protein
MDTVGEKIDKNNDNVGALLSAHNDAVTQKFNQVQNFMVFTHLFPYCNECVDTVKDLGVHVDGNLKFITHISKTVAKAQSRANLIHICFISEDPATLKRAFNT